MEIENKRHVVLLREGARDNALQMFMPLFQKRGIDISISQMKQLLLRKFVNEAGINNLSLSSNYYLLGVARYYFEGKLTTNKELNALNPEVRDVFIHETCERLNVLILILRNAYIDSIGTKFEQPEDFGNLSLEKLLRKYNKKINKALGIDDKKEKEAPAVSDDYSAGKGYTYEILYSYEDAQKYKMDTFPGSWCITYSPTHYNYYIKDLGIHYVIFRQDGYKNVPRKVGQGFTKSKPHDAYGNSLIAVLQSNKSPEPIYITSRWNHGSGEDGTQGTEADHAYTRDEFLRVIGDSGEVLERAYQQWKANVASGMAEKSKKRIGSNKYRTDSIRATKYAQMLINGGKNPRDIEWLVAFGMVDPKMPVDKKMNGAYVVRVRIADGEASYITLMDRKRILMDQLFVKAYDIKGRAFFNGFRVMEIYEDSRPYIIYDTKRHRLFDIDGETRFKAVSYCLIEDAAEKKGYAYVAISGNQVAMLKLPEMEPVRSSGGSAWFESIVAVDSGFYTNQWGEGINLPWQCQEGVMRLVYDSSSGEKYFFNLGSGKFINPHKDVAEGFDMRGWGILTGTDILLYKVSFYDPSSRETFTKLYDPYKEDYISVRGVCKFCYDDIQCVTFSEGNGGFKKTYIMFKPYLTQHYWICDVQNGNMVMCNGAPFKIDASTMIQANSMEWAGYIYLYLRDSGNYIFINPYTDEVVCSGGNPLIIDYFFTDFSNGAVVNVKTSNGEKLSLGNGKYEWMKQQQSVNDARNGFNEVYRRMDNKTLPD